MPRWFTSKMAGWIVRPLRATRAAFGRLRVALRRHRTLLQRTVVVSITVVALLSGIGGSIHLVRTRGEASAAPGPIAALREIWSVPTGDGPIGGLATSGDWLYVTNRDGLFVYPEPCDTREDPCAPVWRAVVPDGPLSTPVVAGDHVYAGSASGKIYAFPATCDAPVCLPLWAGVAGHGPVSTPAVNDDFVYVTSDRLTAFPGACGSEDQTCPAAWSAPVPGGPGGGAPVVEGGLVVVSSASVVGGVFAYPVVCATGCRPVWSGVTQGPASPVGWGDGVVYVTARGRLLAFSLACSATCSPSWTGPFTADRQLTPGSMSAPIRMDDLVYVASTSGALWVFPPSCPASACSALRAFDLTTAPLREPRVSDGLVVITGEDDDLFVVDDTCDRLAGRCPAPGHARTADIRATPVLVDRMIYLGDVEGILHAFMLPN